MILTIHHGYLYGVFLHVQIVFDFEDTNLKSHSQSTFSKELIYNSAESSN